MQSAVKTKVFLVQNQKTAKNSKFNPPVRYFSAGIISHYMLK